ncbi:MAG: carboxypeptidase regulatory-like domain-containing protein [Pyrinomonadaceae bacterium]|nr:carboxypeptidase regulatory-like domain-containing protein [Pyrinomonadaceae bacterium]
MSFKPILTVFSMVACLLAINFNASAQGTTSRITGTIQDNSGAAVAGATVTLTNEGTRTSLTTETSDSGSYTFDLIPAGTYSVMAERQGFKKFVSKENAVNVNQPATVNISMEVGDVSETVTVQGTVESVQTGSSGNLGSTIDQRTIESLPIVGTRGRNPLDLLNFQPGVVVGANTGGGVHVNGSRDRAFNFTLDGIDINESTAGGSNFTPLRPNPDSIQEFQIVTSNFTAELGRSSGAQVTFITRSGTNRLSGNAFEYYQTPEFNANEYQNNLNNGRAKNQFVQHIFGGSVGGPIIKNKFFFFTNLQMLRSYDTVLVTRTVYTQAARNGIFRYVQGGQNGAFQSSTAAIDAGGNPIFPNCSATVTTGCIATYNIASNPSGIGIDPALAAIINSSPLPNNFSSGDGLNTAGFNFGAPQREKQYDFVVKFDYNLADNQLLYVRYGQGEQNTFGDGGNGGRPIFPNSPNFVDTFRAPKNLAINYRWSPTATLTNEFIFGMNKFGFIFETPEPDSRIPFAFNNIATPNTNFSYNARSSTTFQFVDNLTWIKGNHTVKGGFNFRRGRAIDDRSGVAGTAIEPSVAFNAGTTTFGAFVLPAAGINSSDLTLLRNSINNLLGRIGSYSQAFVSDPNNPGQFAPAGTRYNFSANYPEYDFYGQDTWKFRPNLTFDLGLRWEFKLAPTSNGRPILAPDQLFTAGAAQTNTLKFVEKKLFNNDLNNLSPSVGFAWDPFSSGKTSIRANYRLAYDRFPSFLFSSSIFQSTPGNTFLGNDTTFNSGTNSPSGANLIRTGLPNLMPTRTPDQLRQPAAFGTGGITLIDPDLKFPEIHQYALSFQREVFKDTVFEISYIGKHGTNLFGGYDANQVNLNATDARCGSQTFLAAFVQAQNAATAANTNCLASLLAGGTAAGGSAAFRTQFATQLAQNSIGNAAQTLSQRSGAAGSTSPSLTANGFTPFLFQKYPQYTGGLNVLDSGDVSRYNGLEFILKRRFNRGLGFQVGYTFSKSSDTRSFDPTFSTVTRGSFTNPAGIGQSASSTPFDINNRRLNYAPSDFDRRHVLQATYVYELPFGKSKMFGSDIPKALDYVIGGWQIAGNLLWSAGRPFSVFSGAYTSSNVIQSTADCNGCRRNMGRLVQENGTNYWFSAEQRAQFSVPAVGSNGDTGRNFFISPRYFQTDVSLSKKFRVTERFNFDLRLDAKNATNNPSFDIPVYVLPPISTTFGQIRDRVTSNSRRMQVSLKLNF